MTTIIDRTIEQLAAEGRDASEIARRLRRGVDQVQQRARVLKIKIVRSTPTKNAKRRAALLFSD